MRRRTLLIGLGAITVAGGMPPAMAHTLYGQWITYRKKHLLIGCHRKDAETFRLANLVVKTINQAYPKAKARPARTPHPDRLASLLGTDQMDVAVLGRDEAVQIAGGKGRFAAYGRIDLTWLAAMDKHVLAVHARFPDHHAWMLADALAHEGLSGTFEGLSHHPGAAAFRQGVPLSDIPRPAG